MLVTHHSMLYWPLVQISMPIANDHDHDHKFVVGQGSAVGRPSNGFVSLYQGLSGEATDVRLTGRW